MTIGRLESLSLSNFRSIGGEVTVPLDASVVLVHGHNGAGKTSILAAVEFALTGAIESMHRADPSGYLQHLVHRGSAEAHIAVTGSLLANGRRQTWETASKDGEWTRGAALSEGDARYFAERCYLAQATLGRLLEIYASKDSGQDSALTRFVSDVLGLDSLENLIDGLKRAKDIRNTRHLVPEIEDLERHLERSEQESSTLDAEYRQIKREVERLEDQVGELLQLLELKGSPVSEHGLARTLEPANDADEDRLTDLSRCSRDLRSMIGRLSELQSTTGGADLVSLERDASAAAQAYARWHGGAGLEIERVLSDARRFFPDLPSVTESTPIDAVRAMGEAITGELARTANKISIDDTNRDRQSELMESVNRLRARSALVDEQLSDETVGVAEVARLLAELVPHLHDDECVVCGRSYSEVSTEPLAAEAARRASRLSERAARLSALAAEREGVLADLERSQADLQSLLQLILTSSERSTLISRRAQLDTLKSAIDELTAEAALGTRLFVASGEARRTLTAAMASQSAWSEIRRTASEVATTLGSKPFGQNVPLADALAILLDRVRVLQEGVELDLKRRKRLEEMDHSRRLAVETLNEKSAQLERVRARVRQLQHAKSTLDRRRERAKVIHRTALATQRSIVRTVFNDNLNALWRDLFIRLAPNEPFIPAFHVADSERSASPQLTTSYRGGGRAGSPGAMLSAGNLNTAALTLFLALHFSAGDRLPVLLLDDPVQSMDDVHISQFAALLRTISKQRQRQVIIAVHERALFDYLTLELSPSSENDRLITVELKKQLNGPTLVEPTYYDWRNDPIKVSA